MAPPRVRSAVLTGIVVILAATAWLYLAPPGVGGSTTYVVTHGVSMEPHFHTGDLALVRPAADYRVGDVVAYRSSLLHLVVLHRIYAIRHGRYTFKGDNNHFLDPVHPTRARIVGKLWLHIPHGGWIIQSLHTPWVAAVLAGGLVLLLTAGTGARYRRGRRPQRPGTRSGAQGARPMRAEEPTLAGSVNLRRLLVGAGVAAALCLAATILAFTQPTGRPVTHSLPYTQTTRFTYHAPAPAGPVYPTGAVATGDPIFLQLVHRLGVDLDYRLTSPTPPVVHGTDQLFLRLSGSTGWSQRIALTGVRPFSGNEVRATVWIDIPAVQALLHQVEQQTGIPATGSTIAVTAAIRVHGLVDGRPVTTSFSPGLSFQLQPMQLQATGAGVGTAGPAGGAAPADGGGSGSGSAGFVATQNASLHTGATSPNSLSVLGVSLGVTALRLLAPVALIITLASSLLLAVLVIRSGPFGESARIQSKYGHMIVPINAGRDLGWPAIDVASMKALVRLAETSGQLILHSHGEEADTYLVNDEGSVYRYTVALPKVVWGEWTAPTTELAAS
ncbi:MAG TPA: signal peptidase I [Solirubrobacteraceae bacterium]|nr:signal peptidase I [Solirubrobacteraceae bacterium]